MITITSKQEGFRRCGIAHSANPKKYPNKRFTIAQLKMLKAEPMLEVVVSKETQAKKDDQKPSGKSAEKPTEE